MEGEVSTTKTTIIFVLLFLFYTVYANPSVDFTSSSRFLYSILPAYRVMQSGTYCCVVQRNRIPSIHYTPLRSFVLSWSPSKNSLRPVDLQTVSMDLSEIPGSDPIRLAIVPIVDLVQLENALVSSLR